MAADRQETTILTAHELARLLLAGPDLPLMVEDGTMDGLCAGVSGVSRCRWTGANLLGDARDAWTRQFPAVVRIDVSAEPPEAPA